MEYTREMHKIYLDMFDEALELTEVIERKLNLGFEKVYSCYIAVGKEETREFFVDIEVGGDSSSYRRWRGLFTRERLEKIFRLNEGCECI